MHTLLQRGLFKEYNNDNDTLHHVTDPKDWLHWEPADVCGTDIYGCRSQVIWDLSAPKSSHEFITVTTDEMSDTCRVLANICSSGMSWCNKLHRAGIITVFQAWLHCSYRTRAEVDEDKEGGECGGRSLEVRGPASWERERERARRASVRFINLLLRLRWNEVADKSPNNLPPSCSFIYKCTALLQPIWYSSSAKASTSPYISTHSLGYSSLL